MPSAGSKIFAADYNNLAASVNALYGTGTGQAGYGQSTITLPTINIGNKIHAAEWTTLGQMMQVLGTHQGTSLTIPSFSGKLTAATVTSLTTQAATLTTNALVAAVSQTTLFTNVFTNTRASAWGGGSGSIACTFSVTFTSEDKARAFFNSGGQIRIRMSNITGSAQDNDWANTLSSKVGTVTFDYHQTTNSGTSQLSAAQGYYGSAGPVTIYNGVNIGGSAYAANDVVISVTHLGVTGTRGGNGDQLNFTATLTDQYTGSYDAVASGTKIMVDLLKPTGALTIGTPIVTLVSGF